MKRYLATPDLGIGLRRAGLAALSWAAAVIALASTGLDAKADESFVCEDGSVVTVRPGDLEIMKRTNACVAAYSGGLAATQPDVPLPVRKPVMVAAAESAPRTAAGEGLETGSLQDETGAMDAGEQVADRPKGTYRRVYILNAKPGASAWFDHVQ